MISDLETFVLECICPTVCSSNIPESTSTSESGVLNSFSSLTQWAENERELYLLIRSSWESQPCENIHWNKDYHYTENSRKNIEAYIRNFESSILDYFKAQLEHKNGSNGYVSADNYGELVASNLILVYQMTHRLAQYGETLRDLLLENRSQQKTLIFKAIENAEFLAHWPGYLENDVLISTLLWTYKRYDMHMKPDAFVRYLNRDVANYAKPTPEMVYAVAEHAFCQMDYVQGFDWLNYALELTKLVYCSVSKSELLKTKKEATIRHNLEKSKYPSFDDRFYTKEISFVDKYTDEEESWIRNKDYYYNSLNGTYESDYIDRNMWVTCAANTSLMQESLKAKLKCYHETKKHPWLFINPMRVEVLTESPGEILLFHDILGNNFLTEIVKTLDGDEMDFSGVNGSENEDDQVSQASFRRGLTTRSSINTWIEDDEFPKLVSISEVVSGLVATSTIPSQSEAFQAVEYVVGRHYAAHLDALNDFEKGGQTVFLNSGVVSMPRKGSAVYW
ncbi:unnamed protein product [Orchesella dallaii]|uniref:Prolyl 4-hydroxylase alpha subunit domain-containing protein n=1 Tax=Orchesella dallaii TaxID=48710 RepID=A0ABP1PU88_9HEXA